MNTGIETIIKTIINTTLSQRPGTRRQQGSLVDNVDRGIESLRPRAPSLFDGVVRVRQGLLYIGFRDASRAKHAVNRRASVSLD